jgi:hypothetical protein
LGAIFLRIPFIDLAQTLAIPLFRLQGILIIQFSNNRANVYKRERLWFDFSLVDPISRLRRARLLAPALPLLTTLETHHCNL